jgi:DNA polymerase III subunit epsilon
MREIIIDTETTGLDPSQGHRIAEIGCVELINHVPTGRTWQSYLNPERAMPTEATLIHGLTDEFLATQPLFAEKADSFLEFIGGAPLVAHNAGFDFGFLNAELTRHGFPPLAADRAVDTLPIARKMFPGAPASLDALCKRFGVDASGRQWHGALRDSWLLAEVYLELRGGRQPDLAIAATDATAQVVENSEEIQVQREFLAPRAHAPSEEESRAHETFLAQIKDPVWRRSA